MKYLKNIHGQFVKYKPVSKKVMFYLLIGLGSFVSCNNDSLIQNEENIMKLDNSSMMQRIDTSSYEHVVIYNNYEAGISSNGKIDLFKDGSLYNQIEYIGNLGYTTEVLSNKFRIINKKNDDEYYDITDVSKTSINEETELIKFNIKSFDGKKWFGFEYQSARGCPWCWVVAAVLTAVDTILDATSPSDCQLAIDACVQSGGKPTTQIQDGWFSYSCTVICN